MRPWRELTPEEAGAIEETRTLAVEWVAGRLPIREVERLSTGRRRWLATCFTPPDHPAFRPLMRLLDALICRSVITAPVDHPTRGPAHPTKHGIVHEHDVRDAEGRHEGTDIIAFPVRYPWARRPKRDDRNNLIEDGERSPAIFRPKDRRGPVYGVFRAAPEGERKTDDDARPWWDKD